jgi:hypothetical protein
MLGLFKDRELRSQWQRAAELLLAEVATLALSARRLNWLCSTMPCRGVLDGRQCIDHLFGELNRGPPSRA